MKIPLIIVDDSLLVRKGLHALLQESQLLEIVGEAEDGQALLDLLEHRHAKVVLLDITMPGMDGLSTLKHIRKQYPQIKVIMLTNHDTSKYIRECLQQGAKGYLLKSVNRQEVEHAVKKALQGDAYLSPDAAQTLATEFVPTVKPNPGDFHLTPKEKMVLTRIAEGLTSEEMAPLLHNTKDTIDLHRRNMLSKSKKLLGIKTMSGLVAYAIRNGLLEE